jgi:uncharacterized caspase-like protein
MKHRFRELLHEDTTQRAINLVPEPIVMSIGRRGTPVVTRAPQKTALLVGINYVGSPYQLQGCINDVVNMQAFLVSKYKYNNTTLITDNRHIKPTRTNILNAFTKLLSNAQAGDTLFFHFSGHGTQTADVNRDELEGYDEAIVSSDLRLIVDDELNTIIRTYLKSGVTLYAVFDSCHSGTVLDLKYNYLDTTNGLKTTVNSKNYETLANVIMFSGCADNQTSADAYINKKFCGAMTYSLLNALNSNSKPTLQSLLQNMRTYLKNNRYSQVPQLSCGKVAAINNVFFSP